MGWLWAALVPHPPIVLPEVGCGRQKKAEATILGIKKILDKLNGDGQTPSLIPDRLFILSPHQPYVPSMLYANSASVMSGSFAPFGAANVRLSMKHSPEVFANLVKHIEQYIPILQQPSEDFTRDHGSLVPLYFLQKAWQKIPEVYCFNPVGLSYQQAEKLGEILGQYDDGATWGFVGSGDLSHRLTPEAPGGYSPAGKIFDKTVRTALMQGSTKPLLNLSAEDVRQAGECGCKSVFALLGLTGEPIEILSYEAPFGVGYCTALALYNKGWRREPSTEERKSLFKVLPLLARLGITSYLSEKSLAVEMLGKLLELMDEEERELLESPGACFVTIKSSRGELRGCIGTIMPTRESLLQEILANAVAAASQDSRFPPLRLEEFDGISLSVDVLSKPEAVQDITTLDPQKYGVIVTKGSLRGLLLPALEGVDTVEKQLSIAAQKGGISTLEGAAIMRFTVDRYYEVE